jgi:DNA polymerase-3 subunit gamma/tau
MSDDKDKELYRKHRPNTFGEVVGQTKAVDAIKALLRAPQGLPHAMLLAGPSGCGKTTLARILAHKLGCNGVPDLTEINAASARGVDTIRDIETSMRQSPMLGAARFWIIDEAHKLTNDAQNAFLKPLEEPPGYAYFILCTTEPSKLIKTVLSRCHEVKLCEVGGDIINELVLRVAALENITIGEEVTSRIVQVAEGNVRKALVLLNGLIGITDEEKQLATISAGDFKRAAFEIAQALMKKKGWSDIAAILRAVDFEKEEAEGIRYMIISYAMAVLLKADNKSAADMLFYFSKPFFDGNALARKGALISAIYECAKSK